MYCSRTPYIVCPLLAGAFLLRADIAAISGGSLVVRTSTSIFTPATATGNACVTGTLGGAVATASDFVSPIVLANTGFGAPAGCRNRFLLRSAIQPSIFFTNYNLKTYPGFEGDTPASKFPAPVTADDRVQAKGTPVQGSSVFTNAEGRFVSSQGSVAGTVLFRSATLTSQAEVDLSNGQSGAATAETFDPWIFTPQSDTLLTLQIALQDVHLQANADSASILLVDGAFGLGSVPGENVAQTFDEGSFIGVTDGTLDISSRVLLDNTGAPLLLLAGDTYWLTADIEVGAASAVPEPSLPIVIAGAIAGFVWKRPRRILWT